MRVKIKCDPLQVQLSLLTLTLPHHKGHEWVTVADLCGVHCQCRRVVPPLEHPGTAASAELQVHHQVTALLKEPDAVEGAGTLGHEGGGC